MQAVQTLFQLRWSSKPKFRPLPPHIERTFVSTAEGELELLVCKPKTNSKSSGAPPIFFVHGGFGSAGVWLEWMTYLYKQNYPGCTYAYSVRNHGASYAVPYYRMVFATPLAEISNDLAICVRRAEQLDGSGSGMVLVAHSAGGGLSQYALSRGLIKAQALCLVDAVPHFGMADLYWNWFKHDPIFPLRSIVHFGHPSSPLSTAQLVKGAFFGSRYNQASVREFMQWMPSYESMGWPIGQFGSFWNWLRGRNNWLTLKSILDHIRPSQSIGAMDTVCIMIGAEDMMYRKDMYERMAREYRAGIHELAESHTIERRVYDNVDEGKGAEVKTLSVSKGGGVRIVLVHEAGHHVQNDVQCGEAAGALLSWVQQV